MRPASPTPSDPVYEVVWPRSPLGVPTHALAPRLTTLAGARIAFLWDYLFRGDELFPVLAAELRRRYPDVEIVDYPVFGNLHGPDEHALIGALPGRAREHRVDAVVSGNGC